MWATGRLIFLQQHLITEVHPKAQPHSPPPLHPSSPRPRPLRILVFRPVPRRMLGVPEGHETKEAAMNFSPVKGWTEHNFQERRHLWQNLSSNENINFLYESSLTDLITGGNWL